MAVIQNVWIRNSTVGVCMSKPVDVGELRVGGYMMIEGDTGVCFPAVSKQRADGLYNATTGRIAASGLQIRCMGLHRQRSA